jgi:hypothetical protein
LFAFYNITSGGLPWKVALAMDDSRQHWIVWSLLPWVVIIGASIAVLAKMHVRKIDLRLFKFGKLRTESA